MSAYELSTTAQKAIARWSKDDFYVYIRPISSKHAEPGKKEGQWWVVAIQIRAMPPHEFREEGRILDDVIRSLAKRVPRRKDLDDLKKPTVEHIGFLAPHAVYERHSKGVSGDSDLLKKAKKVAEKDNKKAKSKKGREGLLHDRMGPGVMATEKSGKSKKKGKKKSNG